MSFGQPIVDRQGIERRLLRLRKRLRRRDVAHHGLGSVAVGKPGVREGVRRVALERFLEILSGLRTALARPLVPEETALQVELIGFRIRGVPFRQKRSLIARQFDRQLADNVLGDRVLHVEDVAEPAVELSHPERRGIGDPNESSGDPDAIARSLDGSVEDRLHAQFAASGHRVGCDVAVFAHGADR